MQTLLSVWQTAWPIAVAVLVFLLMIMIHEFGHFIFAKMLGVKVNEYAIGFGPTLFKKQGKETKYSLRLIPFGGYCSMEGEESESSHPRGFCNQKPWKRLLIVIAGAVFNILLGFILVLFTLLPERAFVSTTIDSFRKTDSFQPVSSQMLREGDQILTVDGRRIVSVIDLQYAFSGVEGGKLDMTVKRNGETVALEDVPFAYEQEEGVSYVICDFYVKPIAKTFGSLLTETGKQTVSYARIVLFSLVDLIRGKYGISQMSGPVGVTAVISSAAKIGLSTLLPILSLITINLGVFNLLPIPALDGSRALFILIEMIFRKPVPRKYESAIHAVGLVLLLAFIAVITVKDVISFF